MSEYEVVCHECDEDFETDNEEKALGWLFGHGLRTGHDDIEKTEAD